MSKKRLDKILTNTLYEAPDDLEDQEADEVDPKDKKAADTEVEKEKKVDAKDLKDVDKEDLDDEEIDPDDDEVAISVKFNDNDGKNGAIKLISYKRLGSMNSIEQLLQLFDIDPENVAPEFKNRIELTINSPVGDFKNQEYRISLMDKNGEISIDRPNFKTTISKQSSMEMGQAVQQAVGEPGMEQPEPTATPEESGIDLSYLPELNAVYRKTIKNEFFDRILEKD